MGSVPLAGSETHSPSLSLFVSNGAARSPEVVEGEPHWGETCAGIRKGRSANERGTTGQLERSGEVVSGPAGVEPIPVGGAEGAPVVDTYNGSEYEGYNAWYERQVEQVEQMYADDSAEEIAQDKKAARTSCPDNS